MNTKKISKDDKLCFALDYMPVEKQYQKTKKHRNLVNILTIIASGVSVALSFLSPSTAITVAVLSGLVLLPSMYVFNSKMREVIDTVNHSNITFRQFRKMERSGELDKLLIQAKQFQTAVPAYVGIEKLTDNTSIQSNNKYITKQNTSFNTKNNDGRNV